MPLDDTTLETERDALAVLLARGIMDADPFTQDGLNLTATVTRGELAIVVARLLAQFHSQGGHQ